MKDLQKCLKAISDETRFQLFSILLSSDCCVGTLAKHLGVTEANVSQHLQILRKAGLVVGEKRGYWTHYSVVRGKIDKMAIALSGMAENQEQRFLCPKNSGQSTMGNEKTLCNSCCVLSGLDSLRLEASNE